MTSLGFGKVPGAIVFKLAEWFLIDPVMGQTSGQPSTRLTGRLLYSNRSSLLLRLLA
jgi:hypothetical protein